MTEENQTESININLNQGLIIGSIFGIVSLTLTSTYIIPILSIIPSAILEAMFQGIFKEQSFGATGISMILSLITLSGLCFIPFRNRIIKSILNRNKVEVRILISVFFCIQSILIHPLFFYLSLSSDWSRASDGQVLMGIIETFPISSIGLIGLGIILDLLIKNKIKNSTQQSL